MTDAKTQRERLIQGIVESCWNMHIHNLKDTALATGSCGRDTDDDPPDDPGPGKSHPKAPASDDALPERDRLQLVGKLLANVAWIGDRELAVLADASAAYRRKADDGEADETDEQAAKRLGLRVRGAQKNTRRGDTETRRGDSEEPGLCVDRA